MANAATPFPAFDIATMSDSNLADRAAAFDLNRCATEFDINGEYADPREVVFYDAAIARGLESMVLESFDAIQRECEYAAAGY